MSWALNRHGRRLHSAPCTQYICNHWMIRRKNICNYNNEQKKKYYISRHLLIIFRKTFLTHFDMD